MHTRRPALPGAKDYHQMRPHFHSNFVRFLRSSQAELDEENELQLCIYGEEEGKVSLLKSFFT